MTGQLLSQAETRVLIWNLTSYSYFYFQLPTPLTLPPPHIFEVCVCYLCEGEPEKSPYELTPLRTPWEAAQPPAEPLDDIMRTGRQLREYTHPLLQFPCFSQHTHTYINILTDGKASADTEEMCHQCEVIRDSCLVNFKQGLQCARWNGSVTLLGDTRALRNHRASSHRHRVWNTVSSNVKYNIVATKENSDSGTVCSHRSDQPPCGNPFGLQHPDLELSSLAFRPCLHLKEGLCGAPPSWFSTTATP